MVTKIKRSNSFILCSKILEQTKPLCMSCVSMLSEHFLSVINDKGAQELYLCSSCSNKLEQEGVLYV